MDIDWVRGRLMMAEKSAGAFQGNAGACEIRGDYDLNPEIARELSENQQDMANLRPAAVMVALLERPGGLHVLLTRRTDDLEHHPGQISFPGGHVEAGDADATHAAIRETFEETGVKPENIKIIGRLDTYITRTGFSIVPVVGHVSGKFELTPDPKEVAEIFEVPLSHFTNPANHQLLEKSYNGKIRKFYAMPYGDYYIWGATAGMLFNLYEVLTV